MTKLPLVLMLALAVACKSKGGSADIAREEAAGSAAPAPAPPLTQPGPDHGPELVPAGLPRPRDTRKVIRTGRVAIVVAQYDDARAKLDALIARSGGYVDSTDVSHRADDVGEATIVVRIPSDGFDALVPQLRQLGDVVEESTKAEDITDQYVDVDARLKSAQAFETRLLELAAVKTSRVEEVLAVEREVARVHGEIDQLEGRMRQWNDQIALSTLTIRLETKRAELATTSASLGDRADSTWNGSLSALAAFGTAIGLAAIALVPWLVILIPALVLGRRLWRRHRVPRATQVS